MTRISKNLLITLILALVGLPCSLRLSNAQNAKPQSDHLIFNATWWRRTSSDEQQGFIYGYLDCRQIPHAAKASILDYQNEVSALMQSQKGRRDTVPEAIEYAARMLKSRSTQGAENYTGPHGFLDGGWWGDEPDNWGDSDRGYLEGYLECASPPVNVPMVQMYQKAIDRHYASGDHDDDKIAHVLRRLMEPHSKL